MRKPQGKVKDASLARRLRRKLSIRSKLEGTAERPRVVVNRSNKHLRVQVIDDQASKTLFSVQTYGKQAVQAKPNKEGAKVVAAKVAESLKAKNIQAAVFDRNGYRYHGVIAQLVDSVREEGIKL